MVEGVTLRMYATSSLGLGALVVLHAWMQHEQFYPTLVSLTSSKFALIALSNVVIAISCGLGLCVKYFFLGTLRENEYEHLSEKAYPMILDLLLTVTLFRTSLSASFFFMLGALVVAKCFHWLVHKRVEYMGQFPMTPLSHYVRLGVFMVLLALLDALVVVKSVQALWTESKGFTTLFSLDNDHDGPSIHILYGFEFSVLCVMMLGTMVRSVLILWELLHHQGRWDEKSTFIMYSDFASDVAQFGIYTLFFLTLYAYVGLPFTLVRPLLVAFSNFRKRIADLMRYRQATQNMEQRFPDATPDELSGAHNMCIICREDMTQGRKLPCGHVLHLRCLREWLEHQQTCPTCRVPVLDDPNAHRQNANNAQHNHFDIPAAPAAPQPAHAPQAQQPIPDFHNMFPPGAFGPLPPPIHPFYQVFAPFPQHPNFFLQPQHLQALGLQAPAPPVQAPVEQPANTNPGTSISTPSSADTLGTQAVASPSTASPGTLASSSTDETTAEASHGTLEASQSIAPQNLTSSPSLASSTTSTPLIPTQTMNTTPFVPSYLYSSTSPSLNASFLHSSIAGSPFPPDVSQDMLELTSSISRDLDSVRSRVDVLVALMNAHGISTSNPATASSSSPNPL